MTSIINKFQQDMAEKQNLKSSISDNRFYATKNQENDFEEKTAGLMRTWPNEVYVIPTEIAKTAVFSMAYKTKDPLNRTEIFSRPEIKMIFSGSALSQYDCNVWMTCLDFNKGKPIGERIYTTRNKILKLMGITDASKNHSLLEQSLSKLSEAFIRIEFSRKNKKYIIECGLIKRMVEADTGKMYIKLDADGAALFQNLSYIAKTVRKSVKNKPIAECILLYASSQKSGENHRVTINFIKDKLYGSKDTQMYSFRRNLKNCLFSLENELYFEKGSVKITQLDGSEYVSWTRGSREIEK